MRSDMWWYSATCKCKFSLLLHFSFDESFRTSVLDVGVLHLTPPPTISLSFSFLISWKNDKVNSMRTPDGVYSSSWLLSPFSLPSGAYLPWAYLSLSVIIQEGSSLPMLSPCAPAYLTFDLGVVMCRNPKHAHSQLLQCPTLCNPMGRSPPTRLLCPWDLPSKNTGAAYHALLQGIFPIQGLILHLLPWHADSLLLSHQGSPRNSNNGGLRVKGPCVPELPLLYSF